MKRSNDPTTPAFDPSLLDLSDDKKREFFHKARIKHPRVSEVLARLSPMAARWGGSEIGFLIGPGGVGKTQITRKLVDDINEKSLFEMKENATLVPALWMELMSYGEGFSWISTYEQMLEELDEPLIDRKTLVAFDDKGIVKRATARFGSRIFALRLALEEILFNRSVQLIAMDEPVAMIRHTPGARLASHMDTFKSLINRTGTRFVLSGAYDLYALMLVNGQIARRTQVVHFSRYQRSVDADKVAFATAVASLQRYLPLKQIPDLVPKAEILMENCIGCVGNLKQGLTRGLNHALFNGGVWTEESFSRVLMDRNQQQLLLEEALAGEAMLDDSANVEAVLEHIKNVTRSTKKK
jgi:hypothetical protein